MTTVSDRTDTVATGDPETPTPADPHEAIRSETPDAETGVDAAEAESVSDAEPVPERRRIAWSRVIAFGILPGVALVLALASGYFHWIAGASVDLDQARAESVRVAREGTVAVLSYKPDSVDTDLGAARDRLTGDFKDAYTALTREVVIPGAKDKHIAAVAKVNAAAPVSVSANHAVVLLFVNQTVTIGNGAPTDTQPVIRTTLDKVDGRWLISNFDPE